MNAKIEKVDRRTCAVQLFSPGAGGSSPAQSLHEVMKQLLNHAQEAPFDVVTFDLGSCNGVIHRSALPLLVSFSLSVRKAGTRVFILNAPSKVTNGLKEQGLDTLLLLGNPELIAEAGGNIDQGTIDVTFINPFIGATLITLRRQCLTDASCGKPSLRSDFEPGYNVGIVGLIEFKNRVFCGQIALCFPERTFLSLMERMLGTAYESVSSEVADGAAELLNIVFGLAKSKLNRDQTLGIETAIPRVATAARIGEYEPAEATIVLPFQSSAGEFHLEIGLASGSIGRKK